MPLLQILPVLAVIGTVLWLLDIFGLFHSLSRIHVGAWARPV